MVGFVLKYGISRVCDRQYGPKAVVRYEAQVFFDRDAGENVQEQFLHRLEELALPSLGARQESLVIEPNRHFTSATLLCADPAGLSEFYGLYDAKTAQPLAVPGSGALVPKRFHEAYEIPVGDSFTLYDSAMNSSEVRVAGVFNNYFGHLLFFSPAAYRAAFGSEVETNCFLVKTGEMSLDELSGKLSDLPGFLSVKDAAAERTWFNDLSGLINYVVVLMIFIAGMMAYFILVNLSKTYILKKSRELTIMRINGFTVKECVRYAAWDLFLTTVAGILLGMAVGGPLGSWVIQRLEGGNECEKKATCGAADLPAAGVVAPGGRLRGWAERCGARAGGHHGHRPRGSDRPPEGGELSGGVEDALLPPGLVCPEPLCGEPAPAPERRAHPAQSL